jgi:ABC-type transport system involved in multi-copper enzyme maturation permease subunit
MFTEFLKFDLRFQWRTPLLWIGIAVFALIAFAITRTDGAQLGGAIGNVHRNAPYVIVQWMMIFTVLGLFIAGAFVGGTLLRDFEMGTSELFFSKPIGAKSYLLGRYTAGVLVSLTIYIAIAIALILAILVPGIDAARLGPFSWSPYLYALAVFVVPNLIFTSALILLFAATTRSILGVYLAIMAFLVMWAIAGSYTRDLDNLWLAALVDPFGARALSLTTRYWTTEDRNTLLPPVAGYILANRALWLAIAGVLIATTLALFKAHRAGTSARKPWFAKRARPAATVVEHAPVPAGDFRSRSAPPAGSFGSAFRQYLRQTRFDTRHVLLSVPFLILLAFGLLNLVGSLDQTGMYDTPLYPTTSRLLDAIQGSYTWILMIIVMFYGGELVWRERSAKLDGVIDAFPVPNWVPLAAKATALVAVVAVFMTAAALWCMGYQLMQGYTRLEPLLYLKGLALASALYVLIGWLAIVLQVLSNHKFLGYLLTIGIMMSWMVLGTLDFDHNLVAFGSSPDTPYSDMNGYGHFVIGWAWFKGYWTLFTLAALLVAAGFWVRGTPEPMRTRVRIARTRLAGPSGALLAACVVATLATGAWILYNTTVLNPYRASDTVLDQQADFEKRWRKLEDLPQPRIVATDNEVQIHPEERRVVVDGHYRMKNKTAQAIPELLVYLDPDFATVELDVPGATLKEHDEASGMRVYAFTQPLAPGAEFRFGYKLDIRNRGFTNSGAPGRIHYNGTFFNNFDYFPQFGYQRGGEIKDRNERRDRGLGEPRRMPKLEKASRTSTYLSDDSDWIDFKSTVCTAPGQIAMAPGYLQREWTQDGRRCFRYEMDAPILGFWAYLSADWEVKRDRWNDVAIEVYYDRKHPYNVDRMIAATKKSLDYFTKHFGPYQHRQFRILEFPGYAQFAQAFPNTIPYSEAIGFIADVEGEDAVDYVFYVTAHELAHQWWAHQVMGADAQGSTLMSETMAQYSALMVMEQEYGPTRMRKFLKHELDAYLRGRGGEIIEELPLDHVEDSQGYVHYRKGSLVMYRLRDEIGSDAINQALRNYIAKTKFQEPPYTVSTELIAEFRAVAPPDKQQLITDLFERISFYDNRAEEVTAKKRADGKYEVTIAWKANKKESDGIGKESDLALADDIDVGVFARPKGGDEKDEKVLYLQKHRIDAKEGKFTVVVDELPYDAGIDPFNKLIDRVSTDNRKKVTVEG